MKKPIMTIGLITIISLIFTSFRHLKFQSSKTELNKYSLAFFPTRNEESTSADSIPTLKTFSENKLPFTFNFPKTWIIQDNLVEVVDRFNNLAVLRAYILDSLTGSSLTVEYHLPPNGVDDYEYLLSQFNALQGWYANGAKQIKVAGKDALKANNLLTKNGKGYAINPPLRVIIVALLDNHQTGEIQLQFQTPSTDKEKEETEKFNRLLTSFKFSR